MTRLLGRLGGWCARHGWIVLVTWVLAAAALMGASLAFPSPTSSDASIPGTDAQRAHDLMKTGFGSGYEAGGTVQLLVYSPGGSLLEDDRKEAVENAVDRLRTMPHVVEADTPFRMGGISSNLQIGLISVRLEGHDPDAIGTITQDLSKAADPAREAGLEVVPADSSNPANKEIKTGPSEIVGVICALLVLVFAFGTLVAATVPIFAALVSVASGLGVIGLLGWVVDMPKQAGIMATMIGLGVGIDYALFLLSRHRRLLAEGVPVVESVRRTVASSGGAVVFAGGTVIIALSALLLAGFPLLATLGWVTGISVVAAVLTSITLVPALLGLLGHRVNALRVPFLRGSGGAGTGWAGLGSWVARRPWWVLIGSVVVLGALAAPALSLQLGSIDEGYGAQGSEPRRAYELMATGFGPGSNGPLIVVGVLQEKVADADDRLVKDLTREVEDVDGVAHVSEPKVNEDGRSVLLQVVPAYAPSDERTAEVVRDVRALQLPGVQVHVGGKVAGLTDAGDRMAERTPLVIGVVVLLSALLLLLAFRAPLVAIKAAVMNLVSLGAAFGALALVFSLGLGTRLVGMDPPVSSSYLQQIFFSVPIESYVPLMLFAVLFGLSMDYEVFLLTAVRQSYLRHGDNARAVAEGLGSTGRVITSAALIMVAVFTAFIAYPDSMVKTFGVGLAVAVAVDATIIRGFLVPATMVLLGRANWWCPRWLDRILPNLSVEGHEEDEEDGPEPEPRRPDPVTAGI
ncbi:putative drug exporter of the RND superfamily [Nonomuraea maritima]|uniref:Putative drug exporter of the RND superfamily n=1 Tax=Nonomuraea maritima TaxID=683260 RepID=A0A1G8TGY4_9ACTN|nr:MMPL family transporter [Nonomuraea maritima]SDJ40175.1 putative drug exporter of the RND superfamily [Nonomuraea maritima]